MDLWIVVADAGSCRIFQTDEGMSDWTVLQTVSNERIHLAAADLVSGARGATQSRPHGVQSAYDRHTDPHETERIRFAREIAASLSASRARGEWEQVVLVAPPKFLGDLRMHLSEQAIKRVMATVHHDFTHATDAEIPALVRKHLPEVSTSGR